MVKDKNINITLKYNLCLSCEICMSLCPQNSISMKFKGGRNIPVIDKKSCNNCGTCLEFCPGIDIDQDYLKTGKDIEEDMIGKHLDCYSSYCKDNRIRKNATSGGMISSLVTELIKRGEYEAVFTCDFDKFSPENTRLKKINDVEQIFKSARSKYIPVSVFNIMEELKEYKGQKYIIVGTPCMVTAIRKYIRRKKINDENLLFLGLFCERTLNINIIKYFECKYKKTGEKIKQFYYRYKNKNGWPGDVKFNFDTGRTVVLPGSERKRLKKFFQLERCMYCLDKLNRYSDISFGDCYIKGQKDHLGRSSVIVRTPKGREVLNSHSHLFELKEEDILEIGKSQKLKARAGNAEFIKWFYYHNDYLLKDRKNINIEKPDIFEKKVSSIKKYIKWGEEERFRRIDFWFFIIGLKNSIFSCLRKFKGMAGNIIKISIILFEGIFKYKLRYVSNNKHSSEYGNISILGGNLINKGAQAMTFTVVDQLRRKGHQNKIYLLSSKDYYDRYNKKEIYNFDFLPWDMNLKLSILNPWLKYLPGIGKNEKTTKELVKSIKNCHSFIDISGYALSTQWGILKSFNYLLNIIIARKFGIDFYIMPQSIGPFKFPRAVLLYPLLKLYMKYPKKIYIREEQGILSINPYTVKNVCKAHDMVLLNPSYSFSNIFKKRIEFKRIHIQKHAACIIPNLKLTGIIGSRQVVSMYKKIIKKILDNGSFVYILNHSSRDMDLSLDINRIFLNNKRVIMISDDLNAIELESIIKQSDFLIASRYHSILHAYKNNVPAIIIGWALKYRELAENFDQLDYFFDFRQKNDIEDLKQAVENIMKNLKTERKHIKKTLKELRKGKIFDSMFDYVFKS